MKVIRNLVALLGLCAVLSFSTGCANTKPVTPATWKAIATLAAKDGSAIYLSEHPQANNVAAFRTAKSALDLLIADGKFSSEELHKALAKLPVKDLSSNTGIILVDSATVLFITLTGGESVIEQRPVVEAFATGIRDGLEATLLNYPAKAGK